MEADSIRRALADYFTEKADFRTATANRLKETEPWGSIGKNEAYAESLKRVVDYILKLPGDDPELQRMASCTELWFEEMFQSPSKEGTVSVTDNFAIHCGPRGKVISQSECSGWFADWVDTAIAEAREMPRCSECHLAGESFYIRECDDCGRSLCECCQDEHSCEASI
jgi:hypothetical protein